MSAPTIAVLSGGMSAPGSRADAAPGPDELHTPGPGAATNHPPYAPGQVVVRLCDQRLLRVTSVHDLTTPTVDGWIPQDWAPNHQRWLVDAEAGRTPNRPYLPTELRPTTPADLRSPRRRQIHRRLTNHVTTSREG